MKHKYTHWISLFIFMLLLSACKKIKIDLTPYPDELPPITTEGKGTFACLLNGEVWSRCGGFLETSSLLGEYHEASNIFYLDASRFCDDLDDSILISAHVINGIGRYNLSQADYNNFNNECQDVLDTYLFVDGADNNVEILYLDLEEHIVSGTFQCTLVHPDCGDTLYITEGRFDYDWAN